MRLMNDAIVVLTVFTTMTNIDAFLLPLKTKTTSPLVRTNDIDSRRILFDKTQEVVTKDDYSSVRISSETSVSNRNFNRDWTDDSISPLIALHTNNNDDAVSAILAASEEAVALAEASLLKETTSSLSSPQTLFDNNSVDVTVRSLPTVLQPVHQLTAEGKDTVEESDVDVVIAPSVTKILMFAIPAIGVWLCNPLLSLIDTSAVGILSGTVQQAALNPAVAVTDYSALLMAFMYTGTTNLIAAAHTRDKNDPLSSRTSTTLIGVLKLSTFVGMALTFLLLLFANPVLRTLIGNDSINPAVFDAAMKYVRIRALGMPAAAMIGSAQAACLGMQDIKSPLYVLFAAAIVNFIGDLLFVGSSHPWIGGAAGAAWATVFSQYVAATMFIYWLRHKAVPSKGKHGTDNTPNNSSSTTVNLSNAILELTSSRSSKANVSRRQRFVDSVRSLITPIQQREEKPKTVETRTVPPNSFEINAPANHRVVSVKKESTFSARGFLEGKLRKRDLITFPNRETMKEFAPYVIPVTTTVIGRLSGYVAMSHVVSSSLGTISMAAQQVIVSLFYCLCPIADSLSLTAQSFFPSISDSTIGPQRSHAMKQTAKNFLKAGSIFGSIIVAAVCCIPLFSGLFTSDPNVISLVNMVVPYLMGFFAVHGFVCAYEGLLLGRKDLGFLGKMYAVFFFIIPSLMLQVKRAALAATEGAMINLTSVWKIFVGYQLVRAIAWSLRLSYLQRLTEAEGKMSSSTIAP